MAESVDGGLVQQLGQTLAQPREIIFRRQRTRAIGFASLRIGVDQIDIGREIEFAAAQLAQAEYDQSLPTAVGRAHHAMPLRELGFQRFQRSAQTVLRQARAGGENRVHLVEAQYIAPDQARRFGATVSAQLRRPLFRLTGEQLRSGERLRAIVGDQRGQQLRLPAQRIDGEVAGQRDLAQTRHDPGLVDQDGVFRRAGAQAGQVAFDQRFKRLCHRHRSLLRKHRLCHASVHSRRSRRSGLRPRRSWAKLHASGT